MSDGSPMISVFARRKAFCSWWAFLVVVCLRLEQMKLITGDKVYLDVSNISTTQPSWKLSHRRLGPFTVERKIGNGAYWLWLPLSMKQIHPVFTVVKLTLAMDDPIIGRQIPPPLSPEIIDREEEWVVEDILDSKLINQKLWYLVKWKDFGMEHNSWEPQENVHAPEIVAEFYQKHLGATRHIWSAEFLSLPFQPTIMPKHHDFEGGVDARGHWNDVLRFQLKKLSDLEIYKISITHNQR